MLNKAFIPYLLNTGLLADLSVDEFPSQLHAWSEGILNLQDSGTHYGYVYQGQLVLKVAAGTFTLQSGMYFSVPGSAVLLGDGQGIVITRLTYQGMFSIGGPVEPNGRLRYIDGARDTVLVHPPRCGDPVLNALYFPPGIDQTQHTHPSLRVGMVVSGRGECVTPDEVIPLESGQVFVISAGGLHSFKTTDSSMTVIAFHPDSTYGPTHEQHPMIQRTYVTEQETDFSTCYHLNKP